MLSYAGTCRDRWPAGPGGPAHRAFPGTLLPVGGCRYRAHPGEIRTWPATCDPDLAGLALGVSRSTVYEALRRGDFPGRAIRVGGRWRVITASLVELLEAK